VPVACSSNGNHNCACGLPCFNALHRKPESSSQAWPAILIGNQRAGRTSYVYYILVCIGQQTHCTIRSLTCSRRKPRAQSSSRFDGQRICLLRSHLSSMLCPSSHGPVFCADPHCTAMEHPRNLAALQQSLLKLSSTCLPCTWRGRGGSQSMSIASHFSSCLVAVSVHRI
jgi:hypothetical protein